MDRQDRSAWDPALIGAAYRQLERAGRGERLTSLHLQAEIASRHAMAAQFSQTDWPAILAAYELLLALEPTLVVRVNRAVAVGHVQGATAALAALQAGESEREAQASGYRWYFAVRGHFRAAAGDATGAADDLRRAAAPDPQLPAAALAGGAPLSPVRLLPHDGSADLRYEEECRNPEGASVLCRATREDPLRGPERAGGVAGRVEAVCAEVRHRGPARPRLQAIPGAGVGRGAILGRPLAGKAGGRAADAAGPARALPAQADHRAGRGDVEGVVS